MNDIFCEIKDSIDNIIETVDWNTKGIPPIEAVRLVEVKAMLINARNKIAKSVLEV